MSKTAPLSQSGLTTDFGAAKRIRGTSFEVQGHHIRQAFVATSVLSWVGIAFAFGII